MRALAFTVPGEVRGKGRPRIVKIGGFSRMAADRKTATYENLVALVAMEAMTAAGMAAQHFAGPVCVTMTARLVPAASAPRKARAAMLSGEAPPTKKPDADNIGKVVDALNGLVWRDDAQIVSLFVRKVYAETPGLDIVIRPYVNEAEQVAA
jgi:Holliday junction resolvase RusA-like endonuclease